MQLFTKMDYNTKAIELLKSYTPSKQERKKIQNYTYSAILRKTILNHTSVPYCKLDI